MQAKIGFVLPMSKYLKPYNSIYKRASKSRYLLKNAPLCYLSCIPDIIHK